MDTFICPRSPTALSITETGCAGLYKRAIRLKGDPASPVHMCLGCEIGARHAGVKAPAASALQGTAAISFYRQCVQCKRVPTRLIHGRLCLSCFNRQIEILNGRNARRSTPRALTKSWRACIAQVDAGSSRPLAVPAGASPIEVSVAILQAAPGSTLMRQWRTPIGAQWSLW
jgi:hypothetical protein